MVGTVKTVIFHEGPPGLRWWLAASHHVFANAGFADVDAEFEEFSMDARRSPKRIVAAHPANQFASFDRYAGAAAAAVTGFPPPEETNPCGANR